MRKSEKRFARWLRGLDEGWWDDAADGGQFLGSLQEAFEAGWAARRVEPGQLNATSSGYVSHNGSTIPGELVITIWGDCKGVPVGMALNEEAQAALRQGLIRCGVL